MFKATNPSPFLQIGRDKLPARGTFLGSRGGKGIRYLVGGGPLTTERARPKVWGLYASRDTFQNGPAVSLSPNGGTLKLGQ